MTQPSLIHYRLGTGVVAFSSTRHGGYSQGHYAAFNINNYCGDDPAAILKNREALCHLLGIEDKRLLMPHQVHLTRIAKVDAQLLALDDVQRQEALEGTDAVMTDVEGVCIGVSTADCIPILLYDGAHHACCAVHAGWRGTVKRIVQKAVEAMASTYGASPRQLKAVVGPGISLKSFEVGDEVYEQFAQAGFDMARIACKYEKWHIDLWVCNKQQLMEAGVPETGIHMGGICTYIHYDDFFSARRLGINSGRIFSGIMLR